MALIRRKDRECATTLVEYRCRFFCCWASSDGKCYCLGFADQRDLGCLTTKKDHGAAHIA
jgi:hypothetical protein